MANVQKEFGFTQIAHSLLEAVIKRNFTARQISILFCVWRLTYGWKGKKTALITLRTFREFTGISRDNCSRIITTLKDAKVLSVQTTSKGSIVGVTKDYDQWEVLPRQTIVRTDNPSVVCRDNPSVVCRDNPSVVSTDNPIKKRKKVKEKDPLNPPKTKNKKTPLSEPFIITEGMAAWFRKEFGIWNKVLVLREHDAFIDRVKKSGEKWIDWEATWRSHMRNAIYKGWGIDELVALYKKSEGQSPEQSQQEQEKMAMFNREANTHRKK